MQNFEPKENTNKKRTTEDTSLFTLPPNVQEVSGEFGEHIDVSILNYVQTNRDYNCFCIIIYFIH